MDTFPTRYSDLTNTEVNELYRSEAWAGLSRDERLDALQELENRTAEECGNQPCEVRLEEMNGNEYGYYCDGEIVINESLVDEGVLRYKDEDGNVLGEYAPQDVNAQLMDTVHHENYHAYQAEVISGNLEHNDQNEAELWRANEDMYISSTDNEYLYRLQAQERAAFEHGESQTKAAFGEIESKYGEDSGYQEYLTTTNNSYDNTLEEAKAIYGDENIQDSLDSHMLESYRADHAIDTLQASSSDDLSNRFKSANGEIGNNYMDKVHEDDNKSGEYIRLPNENGDEQLYFMVEHTGRSHDGLSPHVHALNLTETEVPQTTQEANAAFGKAHYEATVVGDVSTLYDVEDSL